MKAQCLVLAVAVALASGGCGKKEPGPGPGAPAASAAGAAQRATSAQATQALAVVPSEAFAVGFFDPGMPFFEFVTKGVFLPMSADAQQAFDAELTEFVTGRLGLDLSEVAAVVAFAIPGDKPSVAIVLPGVSGSLRGASDEDGVAYRALPDGIAALVGGTAVLGQGTAVRAAVAVLQGKAEGLDKGKAEIFAELLAETRGGYLGAMVLADQIPLPEPRAMAAKFGLERVFVQFGGGGLHAVAKGQAEGLAQLVNLAAVGLDAAGQQLEAMHAVASDGDAPFEAALTAILQYHLGKAAIGAARPKLDGDTLTVEVPVTMAEVPGIVAIVGMLAAIAIPAFMKYLKKSKSTEARVNLRRLAEGARMLLMEGSRMPPPGGPTPALGSCCASGDKCMPDAAQWASEPWVSLMFSVDDPHYYSYQFVPGPNGFVVRAMGDLDCDGETSLFELEGQLDDGEVILGDLRITGETE